MALSLHYPICINDVYRDNLAFIEKLTGGQGIDIANKTKKSGKFLRVSTAADIIKCLNLKLFVN